MTLRVNWFALSDLCYLPLLGASTKNGVKRSTICPSGWPWSNIVFTLIGISLLTYSSAVKLPLLKGPTGRTGRNTLQPSVNYSLTLNLILCRKRKLNPRRISLLKRKAQHRRKRIQRKKHGKVKKQIARFTAPGFFFTPLFFSLVGGLRLGLGF